MYCKYCGSELPANAKYCIDCGRAVTIPAASAQMPAAVQMPAASAQMPAARAVPQRGMKWYGFLSRFFLPFYGIVTMLYYSFTFVNDYVVRLASGRTLYTALRALIAEYRNNMPVFAWRVIAAALYVLLACFAFAVCGRLKRYAVNAGRGVIRFFILAAVLEVISMAGGLFILHEGGVIASCVMLLVAVALDVVAAACSHAYFKRRADLFVND